MHTQALGAWSPSGQDRGRMAGWGRRLVGALIAGIALGAFGQAMLQAEEPVAGPKTRTVRPVAPGVTKAEFAALEKKVDQILQNQQAMFQRFDAVMEELRIVKVRALINN